MQKKIFDFIKFHSMIIILNIYITIRMLCIFMMLPILTTYGIHIIGFNKFLIGLSISIYGINQILFQIPFGILSDNIGKKNTILIGSILFFIGSCITSLNKNIWGIIFGRAIQGLGPVTSLIISLILDISTKTKQNIYLLIIGINLGITFLISLILGPILTKLINIYGIFDLITVLSIFNIVLIYFCKLQKNNIKNNNSIFLLSMNTILNIIKNPKLLKLNISIFFLNNILILKFISIPEIINILKINYDLYWKIYISIIIISYIISIPIIYILNIEKNITKIHKLLTYCISFLIFNECILLISYNKNIFFVFITILIYFIIFTVSSTILPSLTNKEYSSSFSGTTIGIYSTFQFLGISIGSIIGGFISNKYNIFILCTIILIIHIIWFIMNYSINKK